MLNTGIAFGWDVPWQLGIVVLVLWIGLRRSRLQKGEVLILVGGMVNLVERLRAGKVWDYWQIGGLLWFNAADLLITFGCILWIWQNLKFSTKTKTY